MPTARAYDGVDDLPTLLAVASACWRDTVRAIPHAGDVTWGLYQHEPAVEWPKTVAVLERDGAPIGFGVLWQPQTLQSAIHPDHRDDASYDVLLDWFEQNAGDDVDGGLDVQLIASDESFRHALERRGYAPATELASHHARRLDATVEQADIPSGYVVRNVTAGDAERRVEIHRVAWEPSKFTLPAYERLRTLPPYDETLDLVVEAPGGTFAAYTQVWLDAASGVGELEPVGTHPDHRRLGLARALCLEAGRRLRERGAHAAVVYSVTPEARALYEAAGFPVVDRHIEYRLPRGRARRRSRPRDLRD